MNLVEVSFTPVAAVTMTGDEIALLCECAAGHYDGGCQAAVKPGGVLYGMKSFAAVAPERPHALTLRQLDLLAKIAEIGAYYAGPKADAALRLGRGLRQALVTASNVTPEPVTPDADLTK